VICFWGDRSEEEIQEGGLDSGSHKLVIKDTRRGGATNNSGIGYMFFKEFLKVREVPIDRQYFANFDKVVNEDSVTKGVSYAGYEDEELS